MLLRICSLSVCLFIVLFNAISQDVSVHKDSLAHHLPGHYWFHLTNQTDYTQNDTLVLQMNRECIQLNKQLTYAGYIQVRFEQKTVSLVDHIKSGINDVAREYISNSNHYKFKLKQRENDLFIVMVNRYFHKKMIWQVKDFTIDRSCTTRPQMTLKLVKVPSIKRG